MQQSELTELGSEFYYQLNANLTDHKELYDIIYNPIITAYRGSIIHDLYVPSIEPNSTDDVDIISIVVPSLEHYFGYEQFGSRSTYEKYIDHFDIVAYEANKFIYLLSQCNPNVLSILWLRPEHYIRMTEYGAELIKIREKFLFHDNVHNAFHGYAHQQFKKMTSGVYQGYMGEKRKKLVDQFGYDTKNAAHLVRLLKMGGELMETGVLNVARTSDREELLSIKNGEWKLEDVKEYAAYLFDWYENMSDKSVLPRQPMHRKELSRIAENTIVGFMRDRGEF